MIVVIIAGGSGTRLWPLSTPGYPKHLLKIMGDDDSLLQSTYKRACRLSDKICIVSEVGHVHHVKDQLPELPDEAFIAEPARRGTASCIIAALTHIEQKYDPDEPIAFIAADHYIRDMSGFTRSFELAAEASKKNKRIVLVGVEPNYPATGFGYIQKDGQIYKEQHVYNVDSFKEKPDHDTAVKYLASSNYLWNCSYFIGSVNTFKTVMQANAPDMFDSYQKLSAADPKDYDETYLGLENISVDYALIEKVPDLLVVPASFDWLDMGSFGDLAKAVTSDKNGNYTQGNVELEEVENTLVSNLEEKPVAVIGIDNCVVINTPAGVLVVRKDLSQKVGDVSKRFSKK